MSKNLKQVRSPVEGPPESTLNAGGPSTGAAETEVRIREKRSFTAEYKRRILAEADAAQQGGIAVMLRREGLTYAHLSNWRVQFNKGTLAGARPGRKPKSELEKENEQLRIESARLKAENEKLQTIVDFHAQIGAQIGAILGERKPPEKPS